MTYAYELLNRYLDSGIMAILRADDPENIIPALEVLSANGIDTIEISLVVPGAVEIIKEVHATMGDKILLGAGTVLDASSARAAILAGADFVISPLLSLDVIRIARRYGKMTFAGAYTASEAMSAYEHGSDAVKIFPSMPTGPDYIKAIHAPLPQIPLIPVGGVSLDNMEAFMKAGCVAVAASSSLVSGEMIKKGRLDAIAENATRWVAEMKRIRNLKA